MSEFLSAIDVQALTGKERPHAQRRVLDKMHIPYTARPDGTVVVLRSSVHAMLAAPPAEREPELQF